MKIVNKKEFLNLPCGTIFSYYTPSTFYDLAVKTESLESDFCLINLLANPQADSSEEFIRACGIMENGIDIPLDFESSGREGMFDDEQLYAIYSKKDIQDLINKLRESL